MRSRSEYLAGEVSVGISRRCGQTGRYGPSRRCGPSCRYVQSCRCGPCRNTCRCGLPGALRSSSDAMPSAAVVVDSSEPGKLARLLTLSTSYLSARLTCPLALGRALALTMTAARVGVRSNKVLQSLPLKTAALPGTTALYATTKEKNRQAKLSKLPKCPNGTEPHRNTRILLPLSTKMFSYV